jgi:hypothetical protein
MNTDGPIKFKSVVRRSKPFLDNLGRATIRSIVQDQFQVSDMFATCLTCRNIQTDTPSGQPWCKLYQAFPPLHVLVNSCGEGYDDYDDIPFHL